VQESNLQPSVSHAPLLGVSECGVAFHKWLTAMVNKLRSATAWQFALIPAKIHPFFGYNGGSSSTRTNQSSGVRIDDPDADFKLAKTINKIEARLLLRHSGAGWDWVIVFFSAVYRNSPKIVLARVLDVRRAQDTREQLFVFARVGRPPRFKC